VVANEQRRDDNTNNSNFAALPCHDPLAAHCNGFFCAGAYCGGFRDSIPAVLALQVERTSAMGRNWRQTFSVLYYLLPFHCRHSPPPILPLHLPSGRYWQNVAAARMRTALAADAGGEHARVSAGGRLADVNGVAAGFRRFRASRGFLFSLFTLLFSPLIRLGCYAVLLDV